jgi:hypothetical protein
MKILFPLIFCLLAFGGLAVQRVPAQEPAAEPLINLTVRNEPLGDVLETITRDTGYRFKIQRRWADYEVSATLHDLPLEQGLKRLLRSLNHTIVWEADKTVTIKVFGKVEPGDSGAANSFSAPPPNPEETQPAPEPEGSSIEEHESSGNTGDVPVPDAAAPTDVNPEPTGEAPGPQTDVPRPAPMGIRIDGGGSSAGP